LPILKLDRRQIHRDADRRRPAGRRRARVDEHAVAQVEDQPGTLRRRDEFGGRQLTPARMVPTDKRLETANGAVARRDDRLKLQHEFIPVEATLHLADQFGLRVLGLTHLGPVNLERVGIFRLGPVERDISRAHDVGPGPAIVADTRDPDAESGRQRHILEVDGLPDASDEGFCKVLGALAGSGKVYDEEFVAAETHGNIVIKTELAQSSADFDQDHVAGAMTEGVVDLFKLVEVEHVDERAALLPQPTRDSLLQPAGEVGAIEQPCHGIAMGLLAHKGLSLMHLPKPILQLALAAADLEKDPPDHERRRQRHDVHRCRRKGCTKAGGEPLPATHLHIDQKSGDGEQGAQPEPAKSIGPLQRIQAEIVQRFEKEHVRDPMSRRVDRAISAIRGGVIPI